MGQHREPRDWPSTLVTGVACSVAALLMFRHVEVSLWWGIAATPLAFTGLALIVASADQP